MREEPLSVRDILAKAAGGFLLLAAAAAFFLPAYTKIKELEREKRMLKENIEATKQRIKELSHKSTKAGKDLFYIEKIGREKLGLAKDKEVVVHISRGGAAR